MNKIKRNILTIAAVVAVAFSIFSCADNNSVAENEISYFETMDLWVKKNYPHIPKVEGKEGVYMVFHKGDNGSSSTKPTDSSYVHITYTAQYSDGSYIATTDRALANQCGTASAVARYVPFMFRMVNFSSYLGLTVSHNDALKQMSKGDTVEMVIAPNYGYYYSADAMYEGFGGTAKISGNKIAYVKMVLEDFYDNAEERAKTEVRNYVADQDYSSPETGVFYKKTLINDNEADSVRKDSTLRLKYVGRFTDGFVFDTNDEQVAEDNGIYDSENSAKYQNLLSFHYTNDKDSVNYGSPIKAFRPVISKMRLGEKATFIAYPSLCYGASGQYNTKGTLIFTHTPLIFDIEIIKEEKD